MGSGGHDGSASSPGATATNPFVPPRDVSTTTVKRVTTTTKATAPPPTFQVYATKNPFEPVIQVTTPTSGSTGSTSTTTAGGGGGGGSTTTTTTPSNEPPPGEVVTLLDVFRDSQGAVKARVQVGSTVYTVGEGDTFADGQYRVVSLDSPCGQFLFGDAPFRLCEGEQTIK
jgi:hypothetical protein